LCTLTDKSKRLLISQPLYGFTLLPALLHLNVEKGPSD
jgi:hypothetical protein